MNIKDFLIENYIWILVVILLSIVTIIGFLADKKKSGKKEKNEKSNVGAMNQPQMNQPMMNYQQQGQAPINYQPVENNPNMQVSNPQPMNGPLNFQLPPNTNIQPVNQTMNQMVNNPVSQEPQQPNNQVVEPNPINIPVNPMMNNIPQDTIGMNNPQPVESINPVNQIPTEPMYQPLSEQTPHFAPRDVTPEPIAPSQPSPIDIPIINNPQPMTNSASMVQPINMNPNMQPMNQVPANENIGQMQSQNMNINMQPNNNLPNGYPQPEPNVIPQPVPTPQPANTIPNPVNETIMQQPMNFVYGPSQNGNNQNMM